MTSAKEKYEKTNRRGCVKEQTDRGLMYISTPEEIAEVIKKIPKGEVMTVKQIADTFTKREKVDFTCTLTAGIFVAIIANYVEEEKIKDIPYWRVVKDKGVLYEKYFRLPSKQIDYLKKEGHKILRKGKQNTAYIELD